MAEKSFVVRGKTVTFNHTTQTSDGEVELRTTFDFTNVPMERIIYDAGRSRLITWRAASGIKQMTKSDALAEFTDLTVDCSQAVEKVKVVLPPELQAVVDKLKNLTPDELKQKLADIADMLGEE